MSVMSMIWMNIITKKKTEFTFWFKCLHVHFHQACAKMSPLALQTSVHLQQLENHWTDLIKLTIREFTKFFSAFSVSLKSDHNNRDFTWKLTRRYVFISSMTHKIPVTAKMFWTRVVERWIMHSFGYYMFSEKES